MRKAPPPLRFRESLETTFIEHTGDLIPGRQSARRRAENVVEGRVALSRL